MGMKRQLHGKERKRHGARRRWWPIAVAVLLAAGLVFIGRTGTRAGDNELNAQGLRVSGGGRSDASAVLDPAQFDQPRVREAYAIAQRIPATINQLYCWCGCIENPMMGNHRSALECFESAHAASCDVCLANAEIAWDMTRRGITDAAAIQRAIDERYERG